MTSSERSATGVEVLPVDSALTALFPDKGIRRGSVLGVSGPGGSISLLLAILVQVLAEGSWAAVVGLPSLGIEAATGLGIGLEHFVLVPDPGPRWIEVVAALLDALDVVVVRPPTRCRPADARRLAARVRDRHGVLVLVEPSAIGHAGRDKRWPEPADLQLEAVSSTWHGLERGDGTLRHREVTVRSFGRRSGARERTVRLRLPTVDGRSGPTADEPQAVLSPLAEVATEVVADTLAG